MPSPAKRIRLLSGEVVDAPSTQVRPPPPMPVAKAFVLGPATPTVKQSPETDRELLDAILSAFCRLSAREQNAFGGMRQDMGAGRLNALSYSQRAWAQQVAARLGFDVEVPDDWRETAREIRQR
jgi:hypothetical protein